jgi:hypothetical protein
LNRLRVDIPEDAARFVRSGNVDNDERVPAANVKIKVTRFHEAAGVGKADGHQFHRLRRLRVGMNSEQRGELSFRIRPENIRVQRNSFSNRNCDIALDFDSILSRRRLPLCRKHSASCNFYNRANKRDNIQLLRH